MILQAQSGFQKQFPLNVEKKFWKKAIGSVLPVYMWGLVFLITLIWGTGSIDGGFSLLFGDPITRLVFELFFVFLFILYPLGKILYIHWYIKLYYYFADNDFLTIKKGVFAPREIHVQYKKIQDVYVDQDLLDRIMRLYDIHIASATVSSGMEAHIDGVDEDIAEGLKDFLLNSIKTNSQNDGGVSTGNLPTLAEQPQVRAEAPILFTGNISNTEYPILPRWVGAQIVIRFFNTFLFLAVMALTYMSKLNETDGVSFSTSLSTSLMFFVIGFIVIYVIRVIALFLWKYNYSFKFDKEYLYYRLGVLSISEKHTPYASIQDVRINQSFMERLLGLGTVYIENAAQSGTLTSGISLIGISIEDANKISDILKGVILSKNTTSTNGL